MTALTGHARESRRADPVATLAAPLELRDQTGVDRRGDLVARRPLHCGRLVQLLFAGCEVTLQRRGLGLQRSAVDIKGPEVRVDGLALLHRRQLAVFDLALVAAELPDVGLERLELLR